MNIKVHYISAPVSTFDGDIDVQLTETCAILKYFDVEYTKNVEVVIPLHAIRQLEILE